MEAQGQHGSFSNFSYSPTLSNLLKTGKAQTESGEWISADSLSTENNLHVLRSLVRALRPTQTLEVGLAFGASALCLLGSLRDVHRSVSYRHTAIDPFQRTNWKGCALRAVREDGEADHFRFISEFSSHALSRLSIARERFGLIYIDGSHLFEDVFADFWLSFELLELNGVMLFDDATDPHVRKVLRFIERNFAEYLSPMDLQPHVHPGKSRLKRLANRLGYRQLVAFEKVRGGRRPWNSSLRDF